MAENDDPTPSPDEPLEQATQTTETVVVPPAAPASPRFTERLWNFRSMVAVALAALLLGGGAGAAIAAVSHGDRQEHGRMMGRWVGGPGMPGGPGMGGPGKGMGRLDPQQRQKLRQDFKDLRKQMHDQMEKDFQDSPTPSPATPTPTPNG